MHTFAFEIWEGLLIAARAIRVNKLRSVLTTLGIIIGITSVTAMATVINGIEQEFDASMAELGTDVLYIEKWPWMSGPGTKWWEYRNRPDITDDLAEVVQDRSRYAVAATPVISTRGTVGFKSVDLSEVQVEGSRPSFPRVHAVDLAEGRFYNEMDDRSARNVAVIGAGVAESLFPLEQPLGKDIRIDGHRFEVIGVMAKKGSGAEGSGSFDSQIKIPFNTYKKLFGVYRRSVSVQVRVASAAVLEEAQDEITGILRVARRLDAFEKNDFEINQQQSLREQMAPVKTAIYGIGIFLTALALLVGGIGVMNIMFVSVKERTKEIGLRKAVGARRRTILTQFLIEAVLVCMLGGAIGVLITAGVSALINLFFTAYLPFSTVALAFAICVAIGMLFGLAPAWTAARSDPIESLRYE